jgi:hypothetical protein
MHFCLAKNNKLNKSIFMLRREYEIILVSGMGNEKNKVKAAHAAAKRAWEELGIVTTIIDPDYVSGEFDPTIERIRQAKKSATERGRLVAKVGSSGGGSLILAEEMLDLEQKKGQLPGKNVIICSRTDLEGAPSNLPSVLASAVSLVEERKSTFPFSVGNTLCFTASEVDDVVPSESSVVPHARIVPIEGRSITSHFIAVGAVLLNPQHQGVIADFVRRSYTVNSW